MCHRSATRIFPRFRRPLVAVALGVLMAGCGHVAHPPENLAFADESSAAVTPDPVSVICSDGGLIVRAAGYELDRVIVTVAGAATMFSDLGGDEVVIASPPANSQGVIPPIDSVWVSAVDEARRAAYSTELTCR